MSRKVFLKVIFVVVLVLAMAAPALAGREEYRDWCRDCPGPWGSRYPVCGSWGSPMGPGYGYDYRGWGYGPWGPDRSLFGETISKGEAEKFVEWMIRHNPNLVVGKVTEVEEGYKVQVVTRKGKSLVDTLMVEKDTARVYPVYE
jgi:hypothetical protein